MTRKSYKDLEIYQLALEYFYETHKTTLRLPKYEIYELGSQTRRAADGVVSNIVEGYGRKKHKADFLKFLGYSFSSCLESSHHLEKLSNLYTDLHTPFAELMSKYQILSARIYTFMEYVSKNWRV